MSRGKSQATKLSEMSAEELLRLFVTLKSRVLGEDAATSAEFAQLGEVRELAGELPGALAAYERAGQLNAKLDGLSDAIARLRRFVLLA